MKTVLKKIAIYVLALFLLPNIVPGVEISGGFITLLTGGMALAFLYLIIKPILSVISFPVNLVTLGLFSAFLNVLLLYLLTVFVTGIVIEPFTYPKTDVFGFVIPELNFSLFFAYFYTAFVLSFINSFFTWLAS